MKKRTANKINAIINEITENILALEEIMSELQEKLDSRSDRYRDGEKGEADQAEIDNLQDLIDSLSDVEIYSIET